MSDRLEDKELGISIRFIKCFDAAKAKEVTDADVRLWRRFELQQIINRMNYIGRCDATERANLVAACDLMGHEPTGERFMTAHPIDCCWWCASEFRLPVAKPEAQA